MKSVLRWMLLTAWAFAGLAGTAATAAGVSTSDARAIRAVIEAQLKAMAADDAVLAFSYASPSIRMQFGDAPSFMTMVRHGYPMLIRATEIFFPQPESAGQEVMQVVRLRDQDGSSWRAIYQLQQQRDKSWRINGCEVEPGDDNPSI